MAVFSKNRLLSGLLACSLLLSFCPVFAGSPPESVEDTGISAYYAGDYDLAVQRLRKALQASPDDVNLRYYLADALVKQERLKEARAEYRQILDTMPETRAAELSNKALDRLDNRFKRWTVTVTRVKTDDLDWEVSSKIRNPDRVELQKELGDRVRLNNSDVENVSIKNLSEVKAELAKLPPEMVERFIEKKGEIRVVGSLMNVERTSSGHHRMDAAGLCDMQPNGRVIVYLTVQGLNSKEKGDGTYNVTLHEFGHAMDFLAAETKYGYAFSRSEEFKTIFANESIRHYLKSLRKDGYYISAPQEAFAEMFAIYFSNAATRKQLPPEMITYIEGTVIPKFAEKKETEIQF